MKGGTTVSKWGAKSGFSGRDSPLKKGPQIPAPLMAQQLESCYGTFSRAQNSISSRDCMNYCLSNLILLKDARRVSMIQVENMMSSSRKAP